ncbi:MAG: hypothetical protein II794_07645 [Oscillospiraceae bacterium]|nr:hypothetical protein [Oscillospiraceae bacterium]
MKHRGKELAQRAARALDMPPESVGALRVTVTGDWCLRAENHGGLIALSPESVAVRAGRFIIKVGGENLRIGAMSDAELIITGTIRSLEYLP